MFNINIQSVFKAPSLQRNQRTTAVNRISPINRLGNRESEQTVVSTTTKHLYVMQEASKNYARTLRNSKASTAYRYELSQAQSKDAVEQMHIQQIGSLLNELRGPDSAKSNFIQKHLDLLNKEREKFLASDDYRELPSLHDQVDKETKPWQVEESQDEATTNTTTGKDETDGAAEPKSVGEDSKTTPVAPQKTADAPKAGQTADVAQAQAFLTGLLK